MKKSTPSLLCALLSVTSGFLSYLPLCLCTIFHSLHLQDPAWSGDTLGNDQGREVKMDIKTNISGLFSLLLALPKDMKRRCQ